MDQLHTGLDATFLERHLIKEPDADHPIIEIAPGAYFIESFGNAGAVITSEGIVVIDTGNPLDPLAVLGPLRKVTDLPVRSIIYTHGHADHAANAQSLLNEAAHRGDPRPTIIGHMNVVTRMNRYRELSTYNDRINRMQFRLPAEHPGFPSDDRFIRPDITYQDQMTFRLGQLTFELYHAQGETDDITWVFIPQLKTVYSGDLFINSCPNLGNPLKIQRYEVEWASALEQIASLHAEMLGPGHGTVLRGAATIEDTLLTTAHMLRYLHHEVITRLNKGQQEDQIVGEVELPPEIANHWAMAPIYGCPEFVIRAICRRYTGWWDGNPSHLFPASSADIAQEIVEITGFDALFERAKTLLQNGNPQMALHLLDFLLENPATRQQGLSLRSSALQQRAAQTNSYIAKSILSIAAEQISGNEK